MDLENSLLERLGGMDSVEAIADIFYDKVRNDDCIGSVFMNLSQDAQKSFLTIAFGSEKPFTHPDVNRVYEELHSNPLFFETMLGYLIDSLRDMNVPKGCIDEVVANVETTKKDIAS